MHGLGFYSGWNEYIGPHMITPDPSPFLANQLMLSINPGTTAIHPSQFLESAMDRLITVIQGQRVSEFTRQLNKIEAGNLEDLVKDKSFERAKDMNQFATGPGTLGIQLNSQKVVILETSLHPFQPGSSISHVAYSEYAHTPDFLMKFMQDRGLTLKEAVKRSGGSGPIGPLLLSVFEELGYATVQKPDNVPPIFQAGKKVSDMKLVEVSPALHTHHPFNVYLLFISFCFLFIWSY